MRRVHIVSQYKSTGHFNLHRSYLPYVRCALSLRGCIRLTTRGYHQWERVGATVRGPIHVGAINCDKHRDLCHSFKVHGYPSLVGVNWPGAPEGTPEEPAVNMFKFGSHSFEDTMANIETAFPGLLRVGAPEQEAEEGNLGLALEGGKVGDVVWRTRVAPCAVRLEDATVSVRWILRNDVFTQGLQLTDKRMGECVSACACAAHDARCWRQGARKCSPVGMILVAIHVSLGEILCDCFDSYRQ